MALESILCYTFERMSTSDYLPTIGLEIHAELNTKTKMFCASKNDAAEKRPNINVCPVCMAHPGTLPVINKAAVEHVLRVGAALGASLADYTEFDRKNYFYPDLPKGYQLSQFEYPLVSGGSLNGVKLTRIHLEEDTASSIHDEKSGATLVDYNRAGVPLMELVTEPVLHSAEDCGNFGRELQLLLRTLGASEADMEKGQMRLEANVSVAKISAEDAMRAVINSAQTSELKEPKENSSTAVEKIPTGTVAAKINSSSMDANDKNISASVNPIQNKNSANAAEINSGNISTSSKSTNSDASSNANTESDKDSAAIVQDNFVVDRTGEAVPVSEIKKESHTPTSAEKIISEVKEGVAHMLSSMNTTSVMPNSSAEPVAGIDEAKIDLSKLGTKVEIKNINSFRAMERAIQYEIKRQVALLERGEKVVQETRGWDENKQVTFSQRVKEGSADYRYFPDPDLPSLKLSELGLILENVLKTLPELPSQKRVRLQASGINSQDVELYVKDSLFGGFFEEVEKLLGGNAAEIKLASNYIANDLVRLVRGPSSAEATEGRRDTENRGTESFNKVAISAANFVKIVKLVSSNQISSRSAKDLLVLCMDGVTDPIVAAKEKGMNQDTASTQIEPIVQKILLDNPTVVADYLGGKEAALQYLIGQGMKALKGAANPAMLKTEFVKQIAQTSK